MAREKRHVGVVRFEIADLDSEKAKRWRQLANTIKRITNCWWRTWLFAHIQAGNVRRVQQYLSDLQTWHENGSQGETPVCEVECLTPELTTQIREVIKGQYAELNSRCLELTLQVLGKRIFRMKSGKGNVPRWIRILADDGEFPSSSSPLPIPFDRGNSEIVVPLTDKEDFSLQLRVDRIERPEGKYAASTKDMVRLRTRGKDVASQTALLWRIANGELRFAGSNLVYRPSTNTWFAHIHYQTPKGPTPEVKPERVAFLRPAAKRPWWLRIDGYHHFVGGRSGRHVAYVRQQLLTDRWSRQESYKHASSARKGHGRDRAVGKLFKLQDRWHDFVKTANQQLVQQAVALCVEKKCGKLVYFQPAAAVRESRFLHTAGKVPDRPDGSSWDWGQVATILAYKCQQQGIELVVKAVGEPDSASVALRRVTLPRVRVVPTTVPRAS